MPHLLNQYTDIAGPDVIDQLHQLGHGLRGMKVVHVNSTREGGGVAEILERMIPLMHSLGIDVRWEVISGNQGFFECTKGMHNALQGQTAGLSETQLKIYERTNAENAERLRPVIEDADVVFIHDPQPAALLNSFPDRKGKWIWRCHIDVSRPYRPVWNYLKGIVSNYNASIFSIPQFARRLPHVQFLVPPSIDPLSDKNLPLEEGEIDSVLGDYGIDRDRPMVLQVSRFDRFKDPLGVIESWRMAKKYVPISLVLAGGGASDDPEGETILKEVQSAAEGESHIHILFLPPGAHRTINALQRSADIVIQKSLKEGFGLTVTEAMWKGKPVIGGEVGGIRIQVVNHFTGFLVNTPEGAALRIRYLLHRRDKLVEMGLRARRLVEENFLVTRHLRDYLTLMISLIKEENEQRIEVDI